MYHIPQYYHNPYHFRVSSMNTPPSINGVYRTNDGFTYHFKTSSFPAPNGSKVVVFIGVNDNFISSGGNERINSFTGNLEYQNGQWILRGHMYDGLPQNTSWETLIGFNVSPDGNTLTKYTGGSNITTLNKIG